MVKMLTCVSVYVKQGAAAVRDPAEAEFAVGISSMVDARLSNEETWIAIDGS